MENLTNFKIKDGIKVHFLKTNKFKTNLISVFLTTPLKKENVTANALIPAVLRRGSKTMQTQDEISINLEEMYGATFDCGIDKIGDNQILKFYLEIIDNKFLPNDEDNLQKAINLLLDVIFNPLVDNEEFLPKYVESEKNNLKQVIDGRKDNKAGYALERCVEEMYKNEPYGLYKYGTTMDLDKINSKNLYEEYLNLINNGKIDIFVSGNIKDSIKDIIINNENIKNLLNREANYSINNKEHRKKEEKSETKIEEKMDVNQGKLILGLDILKEEDMDKYTALIYNAILGGTPTSKLFQNVREKNSLAYTASSSFVRQKANIFIKCGIDIENYEKAVEIIKKQIEDMKKGDFTQEIIEEAKKNIISTINFIPDEQDTELMYYFSQELSGYEMSYKEYIDKIIAISKEQIINLANRIQINTIYFLTNN